MKLPFTRGRHEASPRPRRGPLRRLVISVLRISLMTYLAWCGYLYFFQERVLFPASLTRRAGQPALPSTVERLWLDVGAGERVEAWLLRPADAPRDARLPAAIFFHGNAESIDDSLGHAEIYTALGYACLLPEYRGYGRSGGSPSQSAIARDMLRFHDLLAARPDIDPARIVYHGRSVGGGIACDLARARPPAAMVLESTFTSVASFCWGYGVPPALCRNPFRNDDVLRTLDCPVLILHGSDDRLVPVAHARELCKACKDPTYVELPGDHNDFPRDWNRYERAITGLLKALAPAEPAPRPAPGAPGSPPRSTPQPAR